MLSGFRVEWDSRLPPMHRITGLWLTSDNPRHAVRLFLSKLHPQHRVTDVELAEAIKGEAIPNEEGGKMYKIATREYMYTGHDGFDALVGKHCLVDDESGMIMSSIVRKFLLGELNLSSARCGALC